MHKALGDLYTKMGDLFIALGDLLDEWGHGAHWRATEHYYEDAVDLASSVQFTDQPDTDGNAWDFGVLSANDDHPDFHEDSR